MTTETVHKTLRRLAHLRYILVLEGIAVGLAAGLVTVLFRAALGGADDLRRAALSFCGAHPAGIPIWFAILLAAAGLVTLLLKWEPLIGGSGIPQVKGEMFGPIRTVWQRVLAAKFLGGFLSIGAGLSLGREGPSIQLGAMAGKGFSRLTGRVRTEERLLMTCGASAGLAAAFNAPLAGVLFSLEELHKNFSLEVLLPAMASSVTADFLSRQIFGLKPVFDLSGIALMPLGQYWLVLLLGVLLGAFGVVYNACIGRGQELYDKIPTAYLRTVIPFLLAGLLAFIYPAALGGGHGLVGEVAGGLGLQTLLLLLAVRFAFSILSFGSGAPGGIFLPLLVLGSVAGGLLGGGAQALGLAVPLPNFVILGMCGFFSAVVRAPVTGILLICEMTGSFTHMLSLTLVSLTAYAAADLLRGKPIYDQLLHRLLRKQNAAGGNAPVGEKVLLEAPVHPGAPAAQRRIGKTVWPAGCLIVSVVRGERELVPRGDTILRDGDRLLVLCGEEDSGEVQETLERLCKSTVIPARRKKSPPSSPTS